MKHKQEKSYETAHHLHVVSIIHTSYLTNRWIHTAMLQWW